MCLSKIICPHSGAYLQYGVSEGLQTLWVNEQQKQLNGALPTELPLIGMEPLSNDSL